MRCHLRPATEADREFLFSLFRTTMREVIEQTWGWDEERQRADFDRRFEASSVWVVESGRRAAGTVWLEWKPDAVYVHELQIVPELQGQGIGTAVLEQVIAQGGQKALPVTLSVVRANPRAKRLYERMGFEVTGVEPPFIRMRHTFRADFGRTATDYARHRVGFPSSLFERLSAFGIGNAGQQVVDEGTGTGSLARGFARRGCRVIGIDPAAAMMEEAQRLDRQEQLTIEYRLATAEETGLPDASCDVVSAGQCWHWFDRRRAAAEAARILRVGGSIVIAHFDWLPLGGNVVQATEQLIESYNRAWKLGGGLGLHPQWLRDLGEAGFGALETFSYDVSVRYTHEGWRGRIRASAGVAGSLPDEKVRAFDDELARVLVDRYPREPLEVPHRVFAVVARAPTAPRP
jgi:SAM-dependent methyltransferase/ribosomal protein S18 acetylase RimI-like enzyme